MRDIGDNVVKPITLSPFSTVLFVDAIVIGRVVKTEDGYRLQCWFIPPFCWDTCKARGSPRPLKSRPSKIMCPYWCRQQRA